MKKLQVVLAALMIQMFGAPLKSEVALRTVETSAISSFNIEGDYLDGLSPLDFYLFDGLNVPLINIGGKSWYIRDGQLLEWNEPFPTAHPLAETVTLHDGSVLGGPTSNHMRYVLNPVRGAFEEFPEAQGFYWTDYEEGSDMIFARSSKTGPLLIFEDGAFVPSPIPQQGQTRHGEFLPWYSTALGGYFTSWITDFWFYRPGDLHWQKVDEIETRSWTASWGLFQRGSEDFLSPDGSLLRVISENRLTLNQYEMSGLTPSLLLSPITGQWYRLDSTDEIVGWLGSADQWIVPPDSQNEEESPVPQFVRFAPNSAHPNVIEGIIPRVSNTYANRLYYHYEFAKHPRSGALYFVHNRGFSYYSDGVVTNLPESWMDLVGSVPKLFSSQYALYIGGENGIFHIENDNSLNQIWSPKSDYWSALEIEVFDLDCEDLSLGFFGRSDSVYSFHPDGFIELVYQSQNSLRPLGVLPTGQSLVLHEGGEESSLIELGCLD